MSDARPDRILGAGPRHPFYPVAALATIATATSLALMIVGLLRTGDRQYAWLLAGTGLMAAGHTLSWLLALRHRKHRVAIWWLAGSQVIHAVTAPLFMADYLHIAPFLLLMVPLEVCIADRLRRIPSALGLMLAGAIVMIAVDLVAMPNRRSVLTDFPGAHALAIPLFTMHLILLGWMVWYYRMRPKSPFFTRINLSAQQTLITTGVASLSVLPVTVVLAALIRDAHIDQVGQNLRYLAEIAAGRVADDLESHLYKLVALGREPVIQEGLRQANDAYPEDPDRVRAQIAEKERRWQNESPDSPFILNIRGNAQMMVFARFRTNEHSHQDLFLTDRHGSLVAAQGKKPPSSSFATEIWWREAWNSGLGASWFGDLQFSRSTGLPSLRIAAAILDKTQGRIAGVMTSTYQMRAIQSALQKLSRGKETAVYLVDKRGLIIASGEANTAVTDTTWWDFDDSPMNLPQDARFGTAPPDRHHGRDLHGKRALIAHAPLRTSSGVNIEDIAQLDWRVVVSQSHDAALVGVTKATKAALLVGLMVLALSVWISSMTARVQGRPIERLRQTASAMVLGDLDKRAQPGGSEEMAALAEAFNTLTERLATMIHDLREYSRTLEDKVRERTERLRRTQRGLIEGARYSGMAEIASGVLHNIGNVLNSLRVSVQTANQRVKDSKTQRLTKIRQRLIEEKGQAFRDWVSSEKGLEQFTHYLIKLCDALIDEHKTFRGELIALQHYVDQICNALAAQTNFARQIQYDEPLDINEILTDILLADAQLEERYHIRLNRDMAEIPTIKGIRTKLSYAFLSLLENAREALAANEEDDRQVWIGTRVMNGTVQISVRDNGVGIQEDELTTIFQYGYTTKPHGHGFGLHSCANAMREMNGRVWAESEGPGQGAVFYLSLPLVPVEEEPKEAGASESAS
ncbi:Histidine kinase [Sulfidibacter corallicola]|uniref:histidine kinase n=1 Tax=Sulfidibacter corallicola TaxID=2818388 RepID=A0A8A4TP60_SULCO|nr:ATP-binding protein [Sulfidibacter corallicola]QTD51756.1 sensor histidine kinase [Sulfidibacter corallicola]